MWILVFILIVLCVGFYIFRPFWDDKYAIQQIQEEMAELERQRKLRISPKKSEIVNIISEMQVEPRFNKLLDNATKTVNMYKNDLLYVFWDASYRHGCSGGSIVLKLKDVQPDKWTPIQFGKEIEIPLRSYNLQINCMEEHAAIMNLLLQRCHYLTYICSNGKKSRELEDVIDGCSGTLSSSAERLFVQEIDNLRSTRKKRRTRERGQP